MTTLKQMTEHELRLRLASQEALYRWLCEEEGKEFASLADSTSAMKDRKGMSRMLQATRRELWSRGPEA